MDDHTTLIPGLTNDAALYCLALVPFTCRLKISRVCKAWHSLFNTRVLLDIRAREELAEEFLCVFFLDPGIPRLPPSDRNAASFGKAMGSYGAHVRKERNQILLEHGARDLVVVQDHELVRVDKLRSSSNPSRYLQPDEASQHAISIKIKALPTDVIRQGNMVKPMDWFWLPNLQLGHHGPCDLWDLQILNLNSLIFVLGGTIRISGTSLIQELRKDIWVLDLVTKTWEKCAVLEERGKKLVAAGDEKSGKIFIASSDEPQVEGSLPQIKVLDAKSKSWDSEIIPDMPPCDSRRYLHAATCREGLFYLFLIDPNSGNQWSEYYNPESRTWGILENVPTKKAVVNTEKGLFCISSKSAEDSLKSFPPQSRVTALEQFNFELETWEILKEFVTMEGRHTSLRSTIPDCYLVGTKERLCMIESCQEQSTLSGKWEHRTSLSFVLPVSETTLEETVDSPSQVDNVLSSSHSVSKNINVKVREKRACLGGTFILV